MKWFRHHGVLLKYHNMILLVIKGQNIKKIIFYRRGMILEQKIFAEILSDTTMKASRSMYLMNLALKVIIKKAASPTCIFLFPLTSSNHEKCSEQAVSPPKF